MSELATATFGAGCFWGIQHRFEQLDGVQRTLVGYMGGDLREPSYRQVCGGETGHAEVVQLNFDPARISYEELLDQFWAMHDPTQRNRQGWDVGSQYRSVIFYHDESQHDQAEASRERLAASGRHAGEIVTEIVPAGDFWTAEDYHQHYLAKQGRGGCAI